MKTYKEFTEELNEDSTDNAKATLKSIIGMIAKRLKADPDSKFNKDVDKMANSMNKQDSFSPDQAKWIYNTYKGLT